MATFKVGDRARIVDAADLDCPQWVGCEVTILRCPGWHPLYPNDYEITRPSTEVLYAATYGAPGHHLAPLTNPGADAFVERMKRLGREPINDAPKVPVTCT
ncbi:hypothetical protein M0Q28_06850 [Patescibacteria group bacterium]|jgi:hypothetical protein|nr:hypothetical protein [Patescibacteria group bacterium]